MITFEYTARDTVSHDLVKAEVQAESEQAAAKLLIAQNLFPITIVDKEQKKGILAALTGRVSPKDRVVFTRQLATLINAGLPLAQSLRTVQSQNSSPALRDIISNVVSSVEGGATLSASFAQHPKVFNQIYVSLVAAGETSGSLDTTLERLANQQEKDAAILSKIRGALVYPAIVLVVIVAVIIFMLTTLLPQVASLYRDLHKQLPILTRILVATSNLVTHFWWLVVILLVALVIALRRYIKTASGRRTIDDFKLRLPLFGAIYRKVYMARYSRTMSTLLQTGVPMLEGLNIVKNAINNVVVAAAIERSMNKVKGGKALSITLEDEPTFLTLVPQMIKIGEQAGKIDEMLGRVATFYENEVDEEVKNLSTTIEPLLMVVLGVLIGGIIAAILLPIYSLVGGGINLS